MVSKGMYLVKLTLFRLMCASKENNVNIGDPTVEVP